MIVDLANGIEWPRKRLSRREELDLLRMNWSVNGGIYERRFVCLLGFHFTLNGYSNR